jgi:acyl-CoA synthetase (AMP-forming)/AMP-acid ligase II
VRPAIHISSIIDRASRLHPERDALVWQDERLTYGDLDSATAGIGRELRGAGLEAGDRVAILGRNDVGVALGLLSLSRFGFPAVPLNWRLADVALAATASRYRPRGLLFTEAFRPAAEALAAAVPEITALVCLDRDQRPAVEEAGEVGAGSGYEPGRDDIFAFISTGGTEGVPKGIPVTNSMVEASTIAQIASEPITDRDVTLILPQMFHNPHLYVIPPLLLGGKLVVPDMPSFDAELLLRTIEAEGVTRFLGVATMMAYLLDAQDRIAADVSSLKTISYGGAPFATRTVTRLLETFDCGLLQLYGQTEASVLVSTLSPEDHRSALEDERLSHRLESAGRPVPLVDVKVVGDDGGLCPRDRKAIGEIHYRSPSAMAGYFDDPEKTADKVYDGWIKSGDLATWDEEGYLYIVDRRGDMIISGGENVFPSAVEDVIRDVEGVEDVVVVGVPDETWGEVVTAVVLTSSGARVTESEVSGCCNRRLAGYMRPRSIHFVDELPKNASGKVLRGEIKKQYAALAGKDAGQGLGRL